MRGRFRRGRLQNDEVDEIEPARHVSHAKSLLVTSGYRVFDTCGRVPGKNLIRFARFAEERVVPRPRYRHAALVVPMPDRQAAAIQR